jgi:hypothetical protein
MLELYLHSPIGFYGIMLNELRAVSASPFYPRDSAPVMCCYGNSGVLMILISTTPSSAKEI